MSGIYFLSVDCNKYSNFLIFEKEIQVLFLVPTIENSKNTLYYDLKEGYFSSILFCFPYFWFV